MPANSSRTNHIPRVSFYQSYNFLDRDPIFDTLRTMLQDTGAKYSEIHMNGGVTPGTLHNWFDKGVTKRPKFASINAFARALGYEVAFRKNGALDSNIVPKIIYENAEHKGKIEIVQPRRVLSSESRLPVAVKKALQKRRQAQFAALSD